MTRYHAPDATPFIATIGYVRGLKVGHLCIWCEGKREGGWPCHHNSTMSIEGLPDEMTLVSIERRLRCEQCGSLGQAEVRPDWSELTSRPASTSVGWIKPLRPNGAY
jgi:hypothetical protein